MLIRTIFAALLCAGVSGCGGGGGGDSNGAPAASAGTLSVTEDQSATLAVTISDPDGDSLSVTISSPATKGVATVTTNQPLVFSYVPNANANGADAFDYRVTDSRGASATARISVNIAPVADAPVIAAQSFAVAEDTSFEGRIVASEPDGDSLVITLSTTPAHGTFQLIDPSTGAFRYAPAANFSGEDTFTVQASDGALSASGQLTLSVAPINDAPRASDDVFVIPAAVTTQLAVLSNDSDVDDANLVLQIVDAPPGASAVVAGNVISVTPASGVAGPTRLTYRITDASGASASATARFVIGSASPLFFTSDEDGVNRIFRYNMLERVQLDTPAPDGAGIGRFATAANGNSLVYVTTSAGSPARHRVWLKDLTDLAAPVREIPTSAGFFPYWLEVSPDGEYVLFDKQYVAVTDLSHPRSIDSDVNHPIFTKDSRFIYYSQIVSGGGRVVKRVQTSGGGGVPIQMSGSYGTAQGLGLTFGLSADETLIPSTALTIVNPMWGPKSYGYVTPADGSQDDVLLHPALSNVVDHVEQPVLTADNEYAYYRATIGGVLGLYATDLSNPGVSVRLDSMPAPYYLSAFHVLPDSRTFFYQQLVLPNPGTWYRGRIDEPGIVSPFAPTGAPDPQGLTFAPNGSAAVFYSGNGAYVSHGAAFSAATFLLDVGPTTTNSAPLYAPDSNSAALSRFNVRGRLFVVNPAIPGWTQDISPATGVNGVICAAYAGQSC